MREQGTPRRAPVRWPCVLRFSCVALVGLAMCPPWVTPVVLGALVVTLVGCVFIGALREALGVEL
jgi:hypothetical protein